MGVIPHGNDNQPSGTFSDEAIRSRIQIAALQLCRGRDPAEGSSVASG